MLYKIQHTPVFPVSSKNYFFWARKPKGACPVKEGFVGSCPRSKQDLFIIYTSLKILIGSANKRGSKYLIEANFIVDPNDLKKVVVPDAITIKFIDISRINFLGETGKKMALAGFKFLVTKLSLVIKN